MKGFVMMTATSLEPSTDFIREAVKEDIKSGRIKPWKKATN